MRSRWRASGAKIVVAEFVMGHDIDANEYNKMKYTPSYAPKEYRKALPWLDILSEDPEKVDRTTVEAELQSYRTQSEVLRREVGRLNRFVKTLQTQLEKRKEFRTPEEQSFYEKLTRFLSENPDKFEKLLKFLEQL